jgi:hypothetical protein
MTLRAEIKFQFYESRGLKGLATVSIIRLKNTLILEAALFATDVVGQAGLCF